MGDYGVNDYTGAAYIFKRDGTAWTQQAKLTAADAAGDDEFGNSVSIDGDYAIVGAYGAPGGDSYIGAAYIFKRDGASWIQQAKLTAADGAYDDEFGISVSIDGDYAIVGAHGVNDYTGAAYIFKRDGTAWTQQAKLTAADGAEDDGFGSWSSVSISGDYAIVGAHGVNDETGAAYIFKRDGAAWTQQQKLTASDSETGAYLYFGETVSISGNLAIVGSDGSDRTWKGAAYIFRRSGGSWTEEGILTASDGEDNDYFSETGLFLNGAYAIAGSAYKNNDTGAAYVYFLGDLIPPRIEFSTGDLSLGAVSRGGSSADSVKVKNTGWTQLIVSDIGVSGSDSALFSVTPAALVVLPDDSGYVRVDFNPLTPGDFNAALTLTHNGLGDPVVVTLTATARAHQIEVSTALGSVPLGSSSVEHITLKNVGSEQMVVSDIAVSGGDPGVFFVTLDTLTVAPGASVQVRVEFTPVTVGDFSTTLTLTHNGPGSPMMVRLTGRGTATWRLFNARPNPFTSRVSITYEVPEQTHVALTVFNMLGQEVIRLVDQVRAAGRYEVVWNGVNARGAGVASGIYLYRITGGSGYTESKRMALIR